MKRPIQKRRVVGGHGAVSPLGEVVWSGVSGSSGRPSNRTPRSLGLTDWSWEGIHKPTGVFVVGTIPTGHYTRQRMIALRATLEAILVTRLAQEVAMLQHKAGGGRAVASTPAPFLVRSGRLTGAQLAKRGWA